MIQLSSITRGVVVSTPFNESLENNVIGIDKVNLGDFAF